jgi:hypothetical protein
MANVIEIEVDNAQNGQLHFLPIGRSLRGRFDPARDTEPQARLLLIDYPRGVPGQRLALDADAGTAWLTDGLHDAEHKEAREKLKRKGYALPPEREELTLQKGDVPTWLYWIKRAVESGLARLVRGKLPDKIEGPVKKSFVVPERKPDQKDATIAKLTALLLAKLSPAERRQVEEIMAG